MKWIAKNGNIKSDLRITERRGDSYEVIFLDVELELAQVSVPEPISVRFDFQCIDIYSVFSPTIWSGRYLGPNWQKRISSSRLSSGVPVHSLVSLGGNNRLTVAVSDANTSCEIRTGIIEENGNCEVLPLK